jgi:hypothetical protein
MVVLRMLKKVDVSGAMAGLPPGKLPCQPASMASRINGSE